MSAQLYVEVVTPEITLSELLQVRFKAGAISPETFLPTVILVTGKPKSRKVRPLGVSIASPYVLICPVVEVALLQFEV